METVNYQCPACGGPLHFSHESGQVTCDYCDSTFSIQEVEALYAAKQEQAEAKAEAAQQKEARAEAKAATASAAEGEASAGAGAAAVGAGGAAAGAAGVAAGAAATGTSADKVVAAGKQQAAENASEGLDPIQSYLKRSNWNDESNEALTSYVCSSCGAELICDVTTAVTQCPYCGNNSVIPGKLGNTLKPDYVIPFKLGKDDAVAALKQYYSGKKFLPNAFCNENHVQEIQGVYVPFWLYSATTFANGTFEGTRTRTWREGKYQVTETDFYEVQRSGSMDFVRVPVDGSQRMPDAHMDAIEPYDYSELTTFSTAYLPGYLTDRYDLDISDCQPRAYNRMAASSQSALRNTVVGYDSVVDNSCSVKAEWNEVAYALLPVWMLHTKYNGEDFLFAMNGQTGKLIGDLPVDKKKVVGWFFKIAIPIAAVVSIAAAVMTLF